jgi:hypothetical protein
MAHGIMFLETTPDQKSHRFVLQRYESYAKGKFRQRTLRCSVDELRKVAGEMLKYTSDAYAV